VFVELAVHAGGADVMVLSTTPVASAWANFGRLHGDGLRLHQFGNA
jgi:hypothetical protein